MIVIGYKNNNAGNEYLRIRSNPKFDKRNEMRVNQIA